MVLERESTSSLRKEFDVLLIRRELLGGGHDVCGRASRFADQPPERQYLLFLIRMKSLDHLVGENCSLWCLSCVY